MPCKLQDRFLKILVSHDKVRDQNLVATAPRSYRKALSCGDARSVEVLITTFGTKDALDCELRMMVHITKTWFLNIQI